MDSYDKFWAAFLVILGTILITVILTVANYYSGRNEIAAAMVADGVDPIRVGCLLDDSLGTSPTCVALVIRDMVEK